MSTRNDASRSAISEQRARRFAEKYGAASAAGGGAKPQMNVMFRRPGGPGGAAGAMQGSKPKNALKTLARLLRYLSHERRMLILALVTSFVYTIATLVSSYLLRPVINTLAESGISWGEKVATLAIGLSAMAVLYAVSVGGQYLSQRIMLSVSQRSLYRLRRDLYAKLQRMPIRYFDTHASGDIMSRFTNDVDTVGEMLNTTLIQIISGIITIIGTVALMLVTNWILGLITIIMAPVLTFVTKTIMKKGRNAYKKQQKSLGMLNGFAEETITGQKVVKVFNHEQIAMDEFAYLNDELCEAQITAQFRSGIMGPISHQLCNVSYAVTACVGGVLVLLYGLDYGGLAISLQYSRTFNRPINEISMQANTIFSALAGAERVFDVLDESEERPEVDAVSMDKIEGHIVLDNVSFGYTPDVTVLHNISLYAKPGQKIAFVGSTGAGKTTVTNLLSRFYDIKEGSITIDGVPIDRIDRAFLRKNVAMVLQDTHLFTGTVRENIRYGRLDATDEEVIEAAKIASAHSFIMNLEHGYDTMLENDGANLSQGQRQLLNIARAAISRAPILILDEATSSVDTRTEKHIEQGMDRLMENKTTFVIAHRLSTVRKSNAIMVLEGGRIVERGDHDELVAGGGRYADLYHEIAELD